MPNNQQTKSFHLGSRKVKTLFDTWTTNEPPAYVVHRRGSCRENSSFECSVGVSCLKFYHSGTVVIQCSGPDGQKNRSTAEEIEELLTAASDLIAAVGELHAQSSREERANRPARAVEDSDRQEFGNAQVDLPASHSNIVIGGDESGKGELWGPLVVAVVFSSGAGAERIADHPKVEDSKKINDKTLQGRTELASIAKFIRAEADHVEIEIVSPGYIASCPKRSLNGVLLEAYEKCLSRASSRLTTDALLYIDNVNDSRHVRSLKEFRRKCRDDFKVRSLYFLDKGEIKQKMIAAASIVARDCYLSRIEELLALLKREIPTGRPDLVQEIDAQRLRSARSCKQDVLASYCVDNFVKSFADDWIKTSFGR